MQNTNRQRILCAFIIIGLISALFLSGMRIVMESRNNEAAFVISNTDLELLSQAWGIEPAEYETLLKDAGVCDVIVPEDPRNVLGVYFYDEEGGAYHGERAVIGLNEDIKQFSYIPLEGFAPNSDTPMVRVLRLFRYMGNRYGILGYDGAQEIENIIYRAVTERNIRVVWITPFYDSVTGELISEPAQYTKLIENVTERIAPHGLTVGSSVSAFPPSYAPSQLFVICILWGVIAGGMLLLSSILSLGEMLRNILMFAAMTAVTAFIMLKGTDLAIAAGALAAAVIFPCLGLRLMAGLCAESAFDSVKSMNTGFLKVLLLSLAMSLCGGIYISALQSSARFLLAVDNFRGVKISQILPVFYGAYIVMRTLYKGQKPQDVLAAMLSGRRLIIIAFVLVLGGAGVLFILRTGDGMIGVTVFEQRIRNLFEQIFIVRPRTKEFAVAWPCIAVMILLTGKSRKEYAWPFGIMAAPGLSSVANTFCHSRAPVWLSVTRTAIGAGLGAVLGIAAVIILNRLIPKADKPKV